ncbi:Acyl-CoA-binding domain-containing protein 1 [Acorus calamus]|uniref:Acyl-CoA-binding domain-containing protein 1 n=1 Tax=Acorus calamus TaxID=4465 RepID=A0AAV9CPN8_ACOCL|nr:Acyl-CoA-binding domain-containing protein 1 [Acorus calamus]
MGDWQELGQTVLIGLIFSFLVARLISTVVSFRGENLRIVRGEDPPSESEEDSSGPDKEGSGPPGPSSAAASGEAGAASKKIEGEGEDSDDDDDDDWEGVESTELDEAFSAATVFVAATAADRSSPKVSSELQLQLYGLYKIATEGPCTVAQPSPLKMAARAKWNAWQKLGAMPPEEAMEKYIMIVNELYPTWASGSTTKNRDTDSGAFSSSDKGPMGPVFSTHIYEEESDDDLKLDAIHASAREGELDNLTTYLENGVSVNLRDSEGRTPLHWAVDRGHQDVVELLIGKQADVNAMDNEGQTPLHYAVMCERGAIAEFLVKHNADCNSKDNEGKTPCDLCEYDWGFMSSGN